MLKEVMVKRSLEVEKRITADVELLKKHIFALEEEKKTLQSDAKRLEQKVKQISSKHERVRFILTVSSTSTILNRITQSHAKSSFVIFPKTFFALLKT